MVELLLRMCEASSSVLGGQKRERRESCVGWDEGEVKWTGILKLRA